MGPDRDALAEDGVELAGGVARHYQPLRHLHLQPHGPPRLVSPPLPIEQPRSVTSRDRLGLFDHNVCQTGRSVSCDQNAPQLAVDPSQTQVAPDLSGRTLAAVGYPPRFKVNVHSTMTELEWNPM